MLGFSHCDIHVDFVCSKTSHFYWGEVITSSVQLETIPLLLTPPAGDLRLQTANFIARLFKIDSTRTGYSTAGRAQLVMKNDDRIFKKDDGIPSFFFKTQMGKGNCAIAELPVPFCARGHRNIYIPSLLRPQPYLCH